MGGPARTVIALLIVCLFGGLLLGWISLRQAMVDTESFYHFSAADDGSVFLPTDHHLLHISPAGEQQVLRLSQLGLQGHTGRLAPVDGDNFFALVVAGNNRGLHRCKLSARACEAVGAVAIDVRRAHRLYWLPALERLLLVDNGNHRLALLAVDGSLVDKQDGFKYPNGVHVSGDRIFVADTNHHRVAEIVITAQGFGRRVASHTAYVDEVFRWPAEVHKDHWGWLVQLAGDAMGEDVLVTYSDDWTQEYRVDPGAGRDIISSALVSDTLWLALDDRQLYTARAPYTALEKLDNGDVRAFVDSISDQYASRGRWLTVLEVVSVVLFFLVMLVAWQLERIPNR